MQNKLPDNINNKLNETLKGLCFEKIFRIMLVRQNAFNI